MSVVCNGLFSDLKQVVGSKGTLLLTAIATAAPLHAMSKHHHRRHVCVSMMCVLVFDGTSGAKTTSDNWQKRFLLYLKEHACYSFLVQLTNLHQC